MRVKNGTEVLSFKKFVVLYKACFMFFLAKVNRGARHVQPLTLKYNHYTIHVGELGNMAGEA